MPGRIMHGGPDGYPARDEVAGYLADYEERYGLPVHRPVRVEAVERLRRGEVLAAKAGTVSEIREVWEEHAGPLGRFIARRVKNPHDAEDVLQEVFLKTHTALAAGRKPERTKP